jgi:hypothetical protein
MTKEIIAYILLRDSNLDHLHFDLFLITFLLRRGAKNKACTIARSSVFKQRITLINAIIIITTFHFHKKNDE